MRGRVHQRGRGLLTVLARRAAGGDGGDFDFQGMLKAFNKEEERKKLEGEEAVEAGATSSEPGKPKVRRRPALAASR
ncbi:MAG: hypothetical protein ACK4ZJ_18075, partial [Allorhizobium sp.]